MKVIATAGHVDHGKSTLIKALTGIDPDRLKEEKERQMTIDLGFAWLTLPEGETVGVVDVPGHRDFIENMLAGVGSVDAALFVVAADEGVMPQTREHLAILDLLDVEKAVIALTKIDLIQDPDWLLLVQEEVKDLLKRTRLGGSPVVPVSALTGQGLDELVEMLETALMGTQLNENQGRPRLSIDRAFTLAGFGTIVTGTLIGGSLRVGEVVELLPAGISARIRGIQTHKQTVDQAVPGSRVAVNLSGVDVKDISRGDVLAHPGQFNPTRLIDLHLRVLEDSEGRIKHNQEVKFFLGAGQQMARLRLLGEREIRPGQSGWVQLVLRDPVVTVRGDRYILRRPSPPATLGGGRVVVAHPESKHRRFDPQIIGRLEDLLMGSAEDILYRTVEAHPWSESDEIFLQAKVDRDKAQHALAVLASEVKIIRLSSADPGTTEILCTKEDWNRLTNKVVNILKEHHEKFPLRRGLPREELKSRLDLEGTVFSAVVDEMSRSGLLVQVNSGIQLTEHNPQPTQEQERNITSLLRAFRADPYTPPSVKESIEEVGEEVFQYLLQSNKLRKVSEDVVFEEDVYQGMLEKLKEKLRGGRTITVAEARDLFQTSRKYSLALLEYLDQIRVTIREGDERRLAHGLD